MDDDNQPIEVEVIPDTDQVSRHIERPFSYNDVAGIIWQSAFAFPGGVESICWHKYAPPPDQIHLLGKQREEKKRQTKPDMKYVGFISSRDVGEIRSHLTKNGHGFTVTHEPGDGQGKHHGEVKYKLADGATSLSKGEKADLRVAIQGYFGPLVQCEP